MRVVIDTNVIVSAFLSPSGKPAQILRMALQRELVICIDTAILVEYEQVLSRPKFCGKMHAQEIRRFIDLLYDIGVVINSTSGHVALADESDRKFYDVSKASGAVLITGNQKHYPDEPWIKDPASFLEHLQRN